MKKVILVLLVCSSLWWTVKAQSVFESIDYPFEVKKAEISNGMYMAYVDEGEGEVLLFVHGLGSYLPAWQKNVEVLKNHYRCIAVDLIGYGYSSKTDKPWSLKDQSAALNQLMESLGVSKYTLVGHSMGGQISVHHALDYAEKVRRMVLVAPAGIETFTPGQGMMFKLINPEIIANTSKEEIEKNLYVNFHEFPSDAQFMIKDRVAIKNDPQFPLYAHMVVQGIHSMIEQPVRNQLPQLKLPVMVIFGKEDMLIPNRVLNPSLTTAQVAESAREAIPGSVLHLLDGAGHMVMFEKSDEVNALIRAFLER